MRSGRRRSGSLTVIGLGLALLPVAGCSGASSGSPRTQPSPTSISTAALLTKATDDAVAERFMHSTTTLRQGSRIETIRQDDLAEGGRQVITYGSIHAEVVKVGSRAFITGNGDGMVRYFGFPERLRSRLANRWLAFTPSDTGYKTVAAGVGIRADVNDLIPVAPLIRTTATLHGRPVVAIIGLLPPSVHAPAGAKETIDLSQGANPLPIREVATGPHGMTETTTIGSWGVPVTINAPARSTPVSRITGQ